MLLITSTLVLTPAIARSDQVEVGQADNPGEDGVSVPGTPPQSEDPPPPPEELVDASSETDTGNSLEIQQHFTITPTIYLKSREFQPSGKDALNEQRLQQITNEGQDRVHILVQLDFIPRETARQELAANGLELLAYVPDYAWIASVPAVDPDAALATPGLTWAGELTVEDKLDPAILADRWSSWNRAPDDTAAIYVALHKDVSLETGRQLVDTYDGRVMGEVIGINLLVVEMPQANIRALAAEDAIQWIEPAAPPLGEANDGIRGQIGVNTVNAAPYGLDGTGIDVLVYDSGQVGAHVDFGSRLTNADGDTVSYHSTHVAGTIGGDGSNSINQGGTALQWRGMAPAVDLISYGTQGYGAGDILFYNNVPDIENDFAAAQNTYGADIANGSLGSNIYDNDPEDCWVMGKYGSASELLDQIIRGGNSAVGLGDKYVTAWAAGNERNSATSCSNTYSSTAPPAAAKNPIHVGASNTNDNSMASFSSWGPTEDGRIKPIVVAGGEQIGGDNGIKSTSDSPVNTYLVLQGTSMATPAVSGGLALMLQHYRNVYNTSGTFWPSTAKAILMQTADDFGNPGPDFQWGYGQVDIHAAVDLISRKAFRQENIDDDEIDVFTFIVPPGADEVIVSLAWDDYEATFNANPTLINNLNLELVAPDGTLWRPWVLDPNNPANNATRGIDNRNNQEQVQVFSTDEDIVGTWLVRVKGTSVPQGPQDYSLVCEGCQPLNVGACQVEVSGTALLSGTENLLLEENINLDDTHSLQLPGEFTSAGEIWQRSLETKDATAQEDSAAELAAGLEALDTAINQGPEAVVALLDTLRGPALDLAMDDITQAMEQLAAQELSPAETTPVTLEEELAAVKAQQMADEANRIQALKPLDFDVEKEPAVIHATPNNINVPNVDRTVGNGCTYSTVAAAIAAAQPGDRLLIEGGRTFVENISIGIDLTLEGGYDGCATGSSAVTTIDGNDAARVITISGDGMDVTIENLIITNGAATGFYSGGGIYFQSSPVAGTLNLTNVDVYTNTAFVGGGIYIGEDDQVIGTYVDIYENSALGGGGVYLYGGRATFSGSSSVSSYIRDNRALSSGGGVYGVYIGTHAPLLSLPAYADMNDNQALIGSGWGGGVYMREGTISLADGSDIFSNDAILGGGVYLVTSTLTIASTSSEIGNNTATEHGGGIYAQGSTINLDDQAELYHNDAGTDGTGSGGGAYLDDSNLVSDRASIHNNTAGDDGGGVYATNNSVVDMDLGGYLCLDVRCSQLSYNSADSFGGGIYASNSDVFLDNTFVENNSGSLGGGLYLLNSGTSATIYNSLFARNDATAEIGDAVRINSASMTGNGNTLAYNNAGGASTGRAIDLASSNLTLGCSIIWGHSSSINSASQNVSYSDIQGGYAGSTNINVNPLFVSAASQDYHLQTSSPVIDRCPSMTGMGTDFENTPRPTIISQAASPYDMGADESSGTARVGVNGACTYGTIQQAINAASDGDTIRISAGTYFENVDIVDKSLTIEGDYNSSCTTTGGGTTRVEGATHTDSTFSFTNSSVTLGNLEIAWGSGSFGGGFRAISGSEITLDNVDVFNNHAAYGGGIYVSADSTVTTNNDSTIHNNNALAYGGGVRVWGQFNGNGTYSDIYDNCAPQGGGFDVPGGTLNLNAADVYLNQAVDATSQGGGIRVTDGGDVSLSNGTYVYYLNQAYDGAGIYADNAQISMSGGATTLRDNIASNNGGAVYLTNGSTLTSNSARIGQPGSSLANEAVQGAGIYASGSIIDFTGGYIINNIASNSGAGIYANGSIITLTGVQVGGTGSNEPNQLGPSGYFGVGIYLSGNTQALLEDSLVTSNIFQGTSVTYGGGAYLTGGSVLTLTNSTVANHLAPSTGDGRGAGIYANSSTITLDNSQIISNTAGMLGGGIRLFTGSTLNMLNGSIIAHNETLNGEGGGIGAYDSSTTINIQNTNFQDNTASTNGGAIYNQDSTLIVGQSTFYGNTAERGGGIFQTGANAQTEIDNALFHHNTSTTGFGAGIRTEEGQFSVTHVTLADNLGGAGYSQINAVGDATNSIAWGNAQGGFWIASGTFNGACSIDQSGNADFNIDPQFVNPASDNYHLLGSSPAINACATGLPVDLELEPPLRQ